MTQFSLGLILLAFTSCTVAWPLQQPGFFSQGASSSASAAASSSNEVTPFRILYRIPIRNIDSLSGLIRGISRGSVSPNYISSSSDFDGHHGWDITPHCSSTSSCASASPCIRIPRQPKCSCGSKPCSCSPCDPNPCDPNPCESNPCEPKPTESCSLQNRYIDQDCLDRCVMENMGKEHPPNCVMKCSRQTSIPLSEMASASAAASASAGSDSVPVVQKRKATYYSSNSSNRVTPQYDLGDDASATASASASSGHIDGSSSPIFRMHYLPNDLRSKFMHPSLKNTVFLLTL